MERGAAERQLADRVKELNDLHARFDAHKAETNARLATHFDASRQNISRLDKPYRGCLSDANFTRLTCCGKFLFLFIITY